MFTPEDDRWMIVLQDDSMIRCSMIQVRDQAEQVAEHTEGMANYFAGVETSLTAIKEEVIRQIQCFNCVVGIEFEMDKKKKMPRNIDTDIAMHRNHAFNWLLGIQPEWDVI